MGKVSSTQADRVAKDLAENLVWEHNKWAYTPLLSNEGLIDKYDEASGLGNKVHGQERDWCLELYSWAAREAGVPLTGHTRYRVRALVSLAKKHDAWIPVEDGNYVEIASGIEAGDALVFTRSGVKDDSLKGALHLEGAISKTPVIGGYNVDIVAGNVLNPMSVLADYPDEAWNFIREKPVEAEYKGRMDRYEASFTDDGYSSFVQNVAEQFDMNRRFLGRIDMRKLIQGIGLKQERSDIGQEMDNKLADTIRIPKGITLAESSANDPAEHGLSVSLKSSDSLFKS